MSSDSLLQKADFGDIYDQPDPRAYYSTLAPLDYVVPQHGSDLFRRLLDVRAQREGPPKILDVCCSYGVVAMLLKTGLGLEEIAARYLAPSGQSVSREHLVSADRRLLAGQRPGAPYVVGLDVAERAVDYALATGALDAGAAENLELDAPSERLAELLSDVDLVTTTGGVGYVTDRTFERLLEHTPDSTWFATFCLRTYDFGPIKETLSRHGLRTESATRTFPQRRFTDPDEREWAISEVRSLGFDPAGREADGYYHAEFHLSRPESEVAETPLATLLSGL